MIIFFNTINVELIIHFNALIIHNVIWRKIIRFMLLQIFIKFIRLENDLKMTLTIKIMFLIEYIIKIYIIEVLFII